MSGDRESDFNGGFDEEANFKKWMVLWIGASADQLEAAYRLKTPADPTAHAAMQGNIRVMQLCAGLQDVRGCDLEVESDQLQGILNALLSRDAPSVLAAMSRAAWLPPDRWEIAVQAARSIWDDYSTSGEPLQDATWELAISLRDVFPGQLPSTYRIMLYKVLFQDLQWMSERRLPEDIEDLVRCLYPNPGGLSYVPWKPPGERGAKKEKHPLPAPKQRNSAKKARK